MKLFTYRKTHFRLYITLLPAGRGGGKLSFKLPVKPFSNRFVPIGTNCFTRMTLTKFGLKKRKKQGELSFPFDLCISPLASVAKVLKNDFKDFYDDIIYSPISPKWTNKKYGFRFLHDEDFDSREQFIERYNNRIANFRNVMQNVQNPICISVVYFEKFKAETLNSIYESLSYFTGGKPFRYIVFNFLLAGEKSGFDIENLNSNIIYKELVKEIPRHENELYVCDNDVQKYLEEVYKLTLN